MSYVLERVAYRIKSSRELSRKPIQCPLGGLTIGYATRIDQISTSEVEFLLSNRIFSEYEEIGNQLSWYQDAPPMIQELLLYMAYNTGWNRLSTYTEFLNLIKDEEYSKAARLAKENQWAYGAMSVSKNIVEMLNSSSKKI